MAVENLFLKGLQFFRQPTPQEATFRPDGGKKNSDTKKHDISREEITRQIAGGATMIQLDRDPEADYARAVDILTAAFKENRLDINEYNRIRAQVERLLHPSSKT